jgi:acyl-lipid omega-6 desaturase (Delta-12 desaturase)
LASSIERVRENRRIIVYEHANSSNLKGLSQIITTFGALALLWWAAASSQHSFEWLLIPIIVLISLFTLRVFALMHECGHGSLFRTRRLNRIFGFLLGVTADMPQYVWSQHHNYHHTHNGNWEKYRGPYTTLSVDEYAALSATQQRLYRWKCSMVGAPIAGFIYLVFNPRFTWVTGSMQFLQHFVRNMIAHPGESMRAHAAGFKTRYWKTLKEYRHMSWNNVALIAGAALMCYAVGIALFFKIYVLSMAFAGGAGIVLFTVQHNFKHSYASDGKHWDYDAGAIAGTSFLMLPAWLNWFTVNIGYHHIHHLSARIPNYCLLRCHDEYVDLFCDVNRLTLTDVPSSLKYILWDTRARQLISVAEYRQQIHPAHSAALKSLRPEKAWQPTDRSAG